MVCFVESVGERRRNVLVNTDSSIPRRAQIARNQRHRNPAPQTTTTTNQQSDNESDEVAERPNPFAEGAKMGAKKRAKLEAKAEKRQQREAELVAREEKKKRDELIAAEQKKIELAAEEAERKKNEIERLAQEAKARKEHEDYLKLKANFEIEEEGFDENDEDEKENLLRQFVEYIETNKVVVLEDLATHFKLKTQAVIDRISELRSNGTLTGVIDDQGKFIYISKKELNDVCEFIKQRGRVSITELVENSNKLINLKPTKEETVSN